MCKLWCVPQVVAGLDEALLDMTTGEIRRIYVPGDLAFPKGLASAPGRCAVWTAAQFFESSPASY